MAQDKHVIRDTRQNRFVLTSGQPSKKLSHTVTCLCGRKFTRKDEATAKTAWEAHHSAEQEKEDSE